MWPNPQETALFWTIVAKLFRIDFTTWKSLWPKHNYFTATSTKTKVATIERLLIHWKIHCILWNIHPVSPVLELTNSLLVYSHHVFPMTEGRRPRRPDLDSFHRALIGRYDFTRKIYDFGKNYWHEQFS